MPATRDGLRSTPPYTKCALRQHSGAAARDPCRTRAASTSRAKRTYLGTVLNSVQENGAATICRTPTTKHDMTPAWPRAQAQAYTTHSHTKAIQRHMVLRSCATYTVRLRGAVCGVVHRSHDEHALRVEQQLAARAHPSQGGTRLHST